MLYPCVPIPTTLDGYVEMSEEDAALFWKIDTDPDTVAGEESTSLAPDSTEATPVEGLCLRATRLCEPVTALNAPAVDCGTAKAAPTETAQDTKPAAQPLLLTRWTQLRCRSQRLLSRGFTRLLLALRQKVKIAYMNQPEGR